jgi:elongation factor Ts
MNTQEKVIHIRKLTLAPMNKIGKALEDANGNVDEALKILYNQMTKTDIHDMINRVANARIVYSYVHNNRIGAMLVLACQTYFVAKNEQFLNLAKDICIHIVSSPNTPFYVDENDPGDWGFGETQKILSEIKDKPDAVKDKILKGRMSKYFSEVCLLHQPFVKNDKITIKELIQSVSSAVGEKIEVVKFIRMTTNG